MCASLFQMKDFTLKKMLIILTIFQPFHFRFQAAVKTANKETDNQANQKLSCNSCHFQIILYKPAATPNQLHN